MVKIVVDAMSGDNGSSIVVEAVKEFLNKYQDVKLTVVGKEEELESLKGLVEIVDAREVVPMDAGALQVLRMRESSMMKAIKHMKENECDAVVSCGSTGGFLSATTVTLKMIPGVKRAALVTSFPTKVKGRKVTVLDVGASNENNGEELVQFATMGRLYCQAVYNIEEPSVYLLSNGSEEEKGSPEVKEAHKILKESNFPNFKGNLEGRDAFEGFADVLVTGGFAGNVFLKTAEGAAKMLGGLFKGAFKKNLWTKLGYLHVKGGIDEISDIMDYRSIGGAMLLGINGVVVKGHGNSDSYSFFHALRVAYQLAKMDIVEKIKKGVEVNEGN